MSAIGALERMSQRARVSPDEKLEADEREFMAGVAEDIWHAAFTASLIGTVGIRVRPKMLVRRATSRFRSDERQKQEVEALLAYSYESRGMDPPRDEEEQR